jgi:hypothetical protein
MSTSKILGRVSRAAVALSFSVGAAHAAAGCSNDDNAKPGGPVIIGTGGSEHDGGGTSGAKATGGSGGTAAGRDGGNGASTGESQSTGGSGEGGPEGTGGSVLDSGSGGSDGIGGSSGADGGGVCDPATGTDGCFNCPSTTEQFLHQCTTPDVQCTPYDNTKLPLFHGYPLPAIP